MTHKKVEDYLLAKPGARLEYPFDDKAAVYKVGKKPGKMFAIIREGTDPLQVSLKCDPQLALHLRDKYETVMPGYHLNKKHWNTIVLTGQLTDKEVFELVDLSYNLVKDSLSKEEQGNLEG